MITAAASPATGHPLFQYPSCRFILFVTAPPPGGLKVIKDCFHTINQEEIAMRKHVYRILVCLFAVVAALGCAQQHGSITASNGRAPKNVILIIGDGMGPEQVGLLLAYARQAPESVLVDRKTALDQIMDGGVMGISMTYPDNALVVDSAASGTQLASGKFAGSEMIGSDKDGNPVETVLEIAKKRYPTAKSPTASLTRFKTSKGKRMRLASSPP